jgi:hypothetical protein
VDLVELGVAERLGKIDALDLGAQGMAQPAERKRHGDLFGETSDHHAAPAGSVKPPPPAWQLRLHR